jgi:hypothetical protein
MAYWQRGLISQILLGSVKCHKAEIKDWLNGNGEAG